MVEISLDKSFLIQLVNFILLIFILNTILYRPIREAIKKRKQKFNLDQQEITHLKTEATEKLKQFNLAIEEAKKLGLEQKEAKRKEAIKEEKTLLAKTHQEMEKYLKEVKLSISKEIKEVRTKLKEEIIAFSQDIAEKILGRPVKARRSIRDE